MRHFILNSFFDLFIDIYFLDEIDIFLYPLIFISLMDFFYILNPSFIFFLCFLFIVGFFYLS